MPELDRGGLFCPPYKIGSHNTPYKLGLKIFDMVYDGSQNVLTTVFKRFGGGS